jgi:hypothetical protein
MAALTPVPPDAGMSRFSRRQTLRAIACDCALWFSVPALFLYFYLNRFEAPSASVLPHLRYIGTGLLALLLVRALLAWAVPGKLVLRALTTLVMGSVMALLLLYYMLVVGGLSSWGRVISWDLIAGYLPQVAELAATLEISWTLVCVVLVLLYMALLAGAWYYLKRCDWVGPAVQASPAYMLAICLGAGALVVASQVFNFLNWPDARRFEPFALTVFPEQAVSLLNTAESDKLRAAIDRDEDQARDSYQANPAAQKRNVVLFVVDALRADHMGLYGYARDTTPYLSRLALGGHVQIQRGMRSVCAETTCGLFGLNSSKYVPRFSERPFTLQEVLRRHQYAIHMIQGGDHLTYYGLRKIYGKVDSFYDGSMAPGRYSNDDRLVIEKTATLPPWNARPTLLQYHLMSAHTLGKRNAGSGSYAPSKSYVGVPNAYTDEAGNLSPLTQNRYDNGVVQADYTIEKVLTSLGEKGYLSNAVVIITADHGEGLGEHGLYSHANGVQEFLLNIPFVMISYGYQMAPLPGADINASQVDIAPTIVAELNMPAPASWAGVPLQQGRARDFAFFQQAHWRGLVDQRDPEHLWKYWSSDKNHAERAFDLRADPLETRNLIARVPAALKIEWRRKLLPASR